MIDVKKEMAALPPINGNTFWDQMRFSIRELAATKDPLSFFGWSPIAQTINIGPNPSYKAEEENFVLSSKPMLYYKIQDIKQRFTSKFDSYIGDTVYCNLMHQAAHYLHRDFELIPKNWVFEFGSGFGIMLLLLQLDCDFELHLSTYDLPELQIIQKYFLGLVSEVTGIDYLKSVYFETEVMGFPNKRAVNLFIACFSLSEVPDAALRQRIIDSHIAHKYLIVYQKHWQEGFDNIKWFNESLVKSSHPFIKERLWLEQRGFLHYNMETVHLSGI